MILKAIFAIIPAATSSNTIPVPPLNLRSRKRMGNGLVISSSLNKTNPRPTVMALNGRPASATIIPIISSMTMAPGSFFPKIRSALPETHIASGIDRTIRKMVIDKSIFESSQQMGRPGNVPNVPGAKGILPSKQPLERNNIVFFRNVMARLYSLGWYLSRRCCAL